MKRIFFILSFVLLLTVPVLAVEETASEEVPQPAEVEFDVLQEPEDAVGEEQFDLSLELHRIETYLLIIFSGVVALCGVILGCSIGITLIKMWGV